MGEYCKTYAHIDALQKEIEEKQSQIAHLQEEVYYLQIEKGEAEAYINELNFIDNGGCNE